MLFMFLYVRNMQFLSTLSTSLRLPVAKRFLNPPPCQAMELQLAII